MSYGDGQPGSAAGALSAMIRRSRWLKCSFAHSMMAIPPSESLRDASLERSLDQSSDPPNCRLSIRIGSSWAPGNKMEQCKPCTISGHIAMQTGVEKKCEKACTNCAHYQKVDLSKTLWDFSPPPAYECEISNIEKQWADIQAIIDASLISPQAKLQEIGKQCPRYQKEVFQ